MKRSFLITFLLMPLIIIFLSGIKAQDLADSLQLELAKALEDTHRVELLNKMTEVFVVNDPGKALKYNNLAFDLAKELNYTSGIANAYNVLGTIYRYQNDNIMALENYIKAEKLYREIRDSLHIANVNNYIGQIYSDENKLNETLIYFNKALDIFQKTRNLLGLATIYNNIGVIYERNVQDSLALFFYEKALKIDEELGDSSKIALVLMNIGVVYIQRNDYRTALNYFFKSLKYKQANKFNPGLLKITCNIGNAYNLLEQNDSALIYLKECDKQIIHSNYDGMKSYYMFCLSDYYFGKGLYDSARICWLEYNALQQASYNKKLTDKIRETEKRIDFEKNLEEQKNEIIVKSRKIKINRLQKSILFVILIAFVIIGWILFKKKRNEVKYSNEVLEAKNKELVNYAIYILQKNDLIHEFRKQLIQLQKKLKNPANKEAVNEIINSVIFKIAVSKDVDEFRDKLREISEEFYNKLEQKYPNITDKEKQLATLLRLNLSSKQIAVILNNSPESVDVSRYRLRKKIMLPANKNLVDFLNEI